MERLERLAPRRVFNKVDVHLGDSRISQMQRSSYQQQPMYNFIDAGHPMLSGYRESLLESRVCPLTMKCKLHSLRLEL